MYQLCKTVFFFNAFFMPLQAFSPLIKYSPKIPRANSLANLRDHPASTSKLKNIKPTFLNVISDSSNESISYLQQTLELCTKIFHLKNADHLILNPSQLMAITKAKKLNTSYIIEFSDNQFTLTQIEFLSIFLTLASAGLIYNSTASLAEETHPMLLSGLLFFQKHTSLEQIDITLEKYYGSHDYNLLEATLTHLTEEMAGDIIMSDMLERFTAQEGCVWLPPRMLEQSFIEHLRHEICMKLKVLQHYMSFRKKSLFDSD